MIFFFANTKSRHLNQLNSQSFSFRKMMLKTFKRWENDNDKRNGIERNRTHICSHFFFMKQLPQKKARRIFLYKKFHIFLSYLFWLREKKRSLSCQIWCLLWRWFSSFKLVIWCWICIYIYIYLFRRILMINSFKEMHLKRDENKINIIKKINKFLYLISSSKFGISIIKKKYL